MYSFSRLLTAILTLPTCCLAKRHRFFVQRTYVRNYHYVSYIVEGEFIRFYNQLYYTPFKTYSHESKRVPPGRKKPTFLQSSQFCEIQGIFGVYTKVHPSSILTPKIFDLVQRTSSGEPFPRTSLIMLNFRGDPLKRRICPRSGCLTHLSVERTCRKSSK